MSERSGNSNPNQDTTPKTEIGSTREPVIREARISDLVSLRTVLEQSIVSTYDGSPILDEVEDVLVSIEASVQAQNARRYIVAEDSEGVAVGVMGLQPVSKDMVPYTTSSRAGEVINAFVLKDLRTKGTGRALLKQIEDIARSAGYGYEEVVVNSGPRYKETGWPFWNAVYGELVDTALDYYGEGRDAPVWQNL